MSLENLQRVTELSAAFKDAVEKRYGEDPKLTAKAQESLKPGEFEVIQQKIAGLVQDGVKIASEIFPGRASYMDVSELIKENVSDAFLRKNIEIADMTADIAVRIMPQRKAAKLIPKELKKPESIKTLRAVGAVHLADLCAYKKKFGIF